MTATVSQSPADGIRDELMAVANAGGEDTLRNVGRKIKEKFVAGFRSALVESCVDIYGIYGPSMMRTPRLRLRHVHQLELLPLHHPGLLHPVSEARRGSPRVPLRAAAPHLPRQEPEALPGERLCDMRVREQKKLHRGGRGIPV